MSHELFVIDRKPNLDKKAEHRAEYLREKLGAAEDVGVESEARLIRSELIELERGGLITAMPLTKDELAIWSAWLPTTYAQEYRVGGNDLKSYNFDRIPLPVLKKWQSLKKAGSFDSYEIWTPEMQQPDPILLGVIGRMRYLIARWGESDVNLVTFDDIKRKLLQRWNLREALRSLCVVCILAVIYALMWLFPPSGARVILEVCSWGLWVWLLGVIAFSLYELKNDPLRKAIKNHRTVDREMLPTSA